LFASHTFPWPAAPAQAATRVLVDTWPVDPVPAPATDITHDSGVIPSRAVLKFEVKRT
jgi:hypothetical protein